MLRDKAIKKITSKYFYLKSDSPLLKKVGVICFNESLLKMMKNAVRFVLKALFVLQLNFCLEFFGHVDKGLGKKAVIDFKIYDVINLK